MQAMQSGFRRAFAVLLGGIALFMLSSAAMAGGQAAKFVVADNRDSTFSVVGAWSTRSNPDGDGTVTFNSPAYGWDARSIVAAGAGTSFAYWNFGNVASAQGPHAIDVYVPAISQFITSNAQYALQSASWSLFDGCGLVWSNVTTFTFDQNNVANEGQFRRALSSVDLNTGTCYRVRLSDGGTGTTIADAIRLERLFESAATIPDMPFVRTSLAANTTVIPSTSNAVPTIITTLSFTCPRNGNVLVTGSGESAAGSLQTLTFMGLAFSISRDSTATDNANVVQSSSLSGFVGDANRDFLNIQRVDSCTSGTTYTYRLTGYRSQPQTSPGSFIWNGRLVAQFFP